MVFVVGQHDVYSYKIRSTKPGSGSEPLKKIIWAEHGDSVKSKCCKLSR